MVTALSRDHPFTFPWRDLNSMTTTSKYKTVQKHCEIQYEITYFSASRRNAFWRKANKYATSGRQHLAKIHLTYVTLFSSFQIPKMQKNTSRTPKKLISRGPGEGGGGKPRKNLEKTSRNLKNLNKLFSDTLIYPQDLCFFLFFRSSRGFFEVCPHHHPQDLWKIVFLRFSRGFFEVCIRPHHQDLWKIVFVFRLFSSSSLKKVFFFTWLLIANNSAIPKFRTKDGNA